MYMLSLQNINTYQKKRERKEKKRMKLFVCLILKLPNRHCIPATGSFGTKCKVNMMTNGTQVCCITCIIHSLQKK